MEGEPGLSQSLPQLLPLPNLSTPDALNASLVGSWRGPSSLSQDGLLLSQGLSQSSQQLLGISDSQLETMGQGVGLPQSAGVGLPLAPDLAGMRQAIPLQAAAAGLTQMLPPGLPQGLPQNVLPILTPGGYHLVDASAAAMPPPKHPSVCKAEHANSKAARRGPMDEMRQLVRILVKLMPESSRFLTVPDEGGGGNRVKEEHIKVRDS